MSRYLIIPGWAGSGPDHWQSHWERALPGATRVEMSNWLEPRREDWVATIERAVRSSHQPPILVAHSLGCVAVAHWAARSTARVRGALLVAPPDLDRERCPSPLREFAPHPRARLRFPSRLIASDNDPYCALSRAEQIASDWGSDLTIIAGAAHLNTESGHGPWPDGRAFLRQFDEPPRTNAVHASGRQRHEHELDLDDPPWICRGLD
jgi:uncharacterized protein